MTWHDPATGEPLSDDRLAELDAALRSVGDDPTHAVPVELVRLRRESRARAALLADGWVDYAAVGRLRGVSENAARFALHKAAERRAVLLVPHDGATLVPSFQLDPQGQVRDELLTVLEPLMAAGVDPWRAWIWLTAPPRSWVAPCRTRPRAIPRSSRSSSAPRWRWPSARGPPVADHPLDVHGHDARPLPLREGPCVVWSCWAGRQSVTTATPSIRTGLSLATTILSLPFWGSSSRKVRSWL